MDATFKERIQDQNAYYVDGSHKIFSQAVANLAAYKGRYDTGVRQGKRILAKIESKEIVLEQGETIKLVSHSQGSAVSAGISDVLTEAGYTVEVSYNISPKQPGQIPETDAERTVQYGSEGDFVAPQSPMPGVDEQYELKDEKKTFFSGGGHKLDQYNEIGDIPKGDRGYIEPRKDTPKAESTK